MIAEWGGNPLRSLHQIPANLKMSDTSIVGAVRRGPGIQREFGRILNGEGRKRWPEGGFCTARSPSSGTKSPAEFAGADGFS